MDIWVLTKMAFCEVSGNVDDHQYDIISTKWRITENLSVMTIKSLINKYDL